MLYFGEPWDVPAVQYAGRCATPVGSPCLTCGERVVEGDRGWMMPVLQGSDFPTVEAQHAECQLLGVVGHEYGVCTCTGYDTTSREAARVLLTKIGMDPL